MAKQSDTSHVGDWGSPSGRITWLLGQHWSGSRSKMAAAIEMATSSVIKVVTGQQEPGRDFLAAVAKHTEISANWLLTGRGNPFENTGMPVAERALSRTPVDSTERIAGYPHLFSKSRYWIRVQRDEPIVRDAGERVQASDLLLIETKRKQFPPLNQLIERLCVVELANVEAKCQLASVTWREADIDTGAEHLEADTFGSRTGATDRIIIDASPSGDLSVSRHRVRLKTGKARKLQPDESTDWPVTVRYDQIVGICLLVVRDFEQRLLIPL